MFTRTIKPLNDVEALKVEKLESDHVRFTVVPNTGKEIKSIILKRSFGLESLVPGRCKNYAGILTRAYLSNQVLGELSLYFNTFQGDRIVCINIEDLRKILAKPWWWPF